MIIASIACQIDDIESIDTTYLWFHIENKTRFKVSDANITHNITFQGNTPIYNTTPSDYNMVFEVQPPKSYQSISIIYIIYNENRTALGWTKNIGGTYSCQKIDVTKPYIVNCRATEYYSDNHTQLRGNYDMVW